MSQLLEQFAGNNVFTGMVGASVVAGALYVLRGIPGALWTFVDWRLTCSLTIFSEDAAFDRVNEWLASLEYTQSCRRMRMTVNYDEHTSEQRELLVPGVGKHLIWYRGRPVLIERSLPDKGGIGGGWKRFEDIHIRTLGGNGKLLRSLVKEISEARQKSHAKTVEVFLYRQRWRIACRKTKRELSTVVLAPGQKESVLRDADWFVASRKWYAERGVPYRRGYLLKGPPGCGKTTLAMLIAGHLGRPIYALNLGSLGGDDALVDAIADVPEHAILLFEDVDAASVGMKRDSKPQRTTPTAAPGAPATIEKEAETGITLSGLLNVIDGVFSRDGRLLIMTTNHPEKLDPALLRPGRADRHEQIGPLDRDGARSLAARFLGDDICGISAFLDGLTFPITPASLQEALLRRETGAAA